MKNKRGIFFGMYLVMLTLFLCTLVITLYMLQLQKGNIDSSLVSPEEIISIQMQLEVFEMGEFDLIKTSLEKVEGIDFKKDEEFEKEFRKIFIEEFKAKNWEEFILKNLTVEGKEVSEGFSGEGLIETILYPSKNFYFKNGKLIVERGKVGKYLELNAVKPDKINYKVDFYFEFERKYEITFENNKFIVEKK